VDDTCAVRATGDPWLYALGDVNRHALLTHQGKYQARVAGAVIAARGPVLPDDQRGLAPAARGLPGRTRRRLRHLGGLAAPGWPDGIGAP
jgi:hypothetical protein